jgi:hypothetical protein
LDPQRLSELRNYADVIRMPSHPPLIHSTGVRKSFPIVTPNESPRWKSQSDV